MMTEEWWQQRWWAGMTGKWRWWRWWIIACRRREVHHEEIPPSGLDMWLEVKTIHIASHAHDMRHASIFAYTARHKPSLHILACWNAIRCLGPKLGHVGLIPRLHAVLRLLKYIYWHGRSLEARWHLGITGRAQMEGRRDGDSEGWTMSLELKSNTSLHIINAVHTVQAQTLMYRSRFLAILTLAAGPRPQENRPW